MFLQFQGYGQVCSHPWPGYPNHRAMEMVPGLGQQVEKLLKEAGGWCNGHTLCILHCVLLFIFLEMTTFFFFFFFFLLIHHKLFSLWIPSQWEKKYTSLFCFLLGLLKTCPWSMGIMETLRRQKLSFFMGGGPSPAVFMVTKRAKPSKTWCLPNCFCVQSYSL